LYNDRDDDGNPVVVTGVLNGPYNGTLNMLTNGYYDYNANPGFTGTDFFEYRMRDVSTDPIYDTGVVYIHVIDEVSLTAFPVAISDFGLGLMDMTLTGNVLSNDFVQGSYQDLYIDTAPILVPSDGTVTLTDDGGFIYVPDGGFTGRDRFKYLVASDSLMTTFAIGTVNIRIIEPRPGVDYPPYAGDDVEYVQQDRTATGSTTSNDHGFDAPGYVINPVPVDSPMHGKVFYNSLGDYTYLPDSGYLGPDRFSYEVCDDLDPTNCTQASVYIMIQPPPVIDVSVKAYLEGSYDSTHVLMRNNLNSYCDVLPLSHPYSGAPWLHNGTESVPYMPAEAVDWVLVTFRSSRNAPDKIFSEAALLYQDGSIHRTNGDTAWSFEQVYAGESIWVLIEHTNHVGALTARPILVPADGMVDFTASQSYVPSTPVGGSPAAGQNIVEYHALTGDAIYALISGDAINDYDVNSSDISVIQANFMHFEVYDAGDLNMDCDINSSDLSQIVKNFNLFSGVSH
jgi:hypothetical protein